MADSPAREETDLEGVGAVAERLDDLTVRERARVPRRSLLRVAVVALVYLGVLVVLFVAVGGGGRPGVAATGLVPVVVGLSFVFETIDSASGMGFGTTLTPLLFAMGFAPLEVVPALLVSEGLTGIVAAAVHHEFGNARFAVSRTPTPATRVALLLMAAGIAGTVLSITLAYVAFSLPARLLELYVALLVVGMGLFGLVREALPRSRTYRSDLLVGFAVLAGVNKGIASGGYGPVVTLGQIFAGVNEKAATAIASLSEGVVSVVGAGAYLALLAGGLPVDYVLLPSLVTGAFFASLVAPYAVRVLPRWVLGYAIPLYAVVIGLVVLGQLLLV